MEEPRTCLLAARRELTQILCNILQRYIYQGLNYYWQQSKIAATPGNVYATFQRKLELIPSWNQETVEAEFSRICEKSRCSYLDDLIRKVFIYNTQILTAADSVPNRNIRVKVPRGDRFVHRCYITCARAFWESAWLLDDRDQFISKLEQAKNLHKAYKLICTSIENTIREMLPIEDIVSSHFESASAPEPQVTQVARIDDLFRSTVPPQHMMPQAPPMSPQEPDSKSILGSHHGGGPDIDDDDIQSRLSAVLSKSSALKEDINDFEKTMEPQEGDNDDYSDNVSDVSQPLSFVDTLEKVIYLGAEVPKVTKQQPEPRSSYPEEPRSYQEETRDAGDNNSVSDGASMTEEALSNYTSKENKPPVDVSIDLPKQEVLFDVDDRQSVIANDADQSEFNFFDDTRTVM